MTKRHKVTLDCMQCDNDQKFHRFKNYCVTQENQIVNPLKLIQNAPLDICEPEYTFNFIDGKCVRMKNETEPKDNVNNNINIDIDKEINPKTGKLVQKCKEGYFRNPETGRCKKKVNTRDKEINPKTGNLVQKCKEGYLRNPETGRCKKLKNNNDKININSNYITMDGGAPRLTRGELNALLKEGFKGVDIKVEELKKKKDGQKKSKKNKK